MSNPLKCGIIGYGYMGEIRRRVIEASPRMQLMGIVESEAKKRAKITDAPTFDSLDTLLLEPVDAIFVATPNCYAPALCVQSLKAGKHVFCEKPPGRNLEDVQNIIEAEQSAPGLKLMFGFNHRFHPAVIKAKALVESGRYGKVLSLRGIYGKSGGRNYRTSWRNDKSISGGGILLDQGIHMLDLFRYFCGDFEYVKCFTSHSFWQMEVEDNAHVILSNTRSQQASFHSSATMWKHTFKLDVMLEEGYMVIEGLLSKTGSYGREKLTVARRQFEDEAEAVGNPAEEITQFDRDLSWELEMAEFVRCIEANEPVRVSSSYDALKVMEIIYRAYEDARLHSGREEAL